MQRVMCIWIPDWPLVRLAMERPELHRRTVVIYEASPQGGLKIVAATSALGRSCDRLAAESAGDVDVIAGIYPGMPLAEATAIIAHARASVESALGGRSVGNALRGVPEAPIDATPLRAAGTALATASRPRPFPTEIELHPHLEPADPDADRLALVQLAQWCQRFSPIVGIEDAPRPECLLLNVTGLAHLFGGERALAEEIIRMLAKRGMPVHVAIADTLGAAWAMAHAGYSANRIMMDDSPLLDILPSGHVIAALAPLPIGYLRVADETIALLGTLGIYRIGQLTALPRSALLARFGGELLLRLDQAMGQAPETILACRPPAEYASEFTFEVPMANREAIEHVLSELIPRVVEPLARRREGVLRLTCRLKYEPAWEGESNLEGPTQATFCVGLFRPSASADYLRDLLRLRLETVRLVGPVTSVQVEVTAIGPLELTQQALFEGGQNQGQRRRLAELVDRLSNRLGRNMVVQVALLPDAQPEFACADMPLAGGASLPVGNGRSLFAVASAVPGVRMGPERHGGRSLQKTRTSKKNLKKRAKKNLAHVSRYGLLSFAADERPLALLPQPARMEVIAIAPDGLPARFRWLGRSYSIARTWGPERIETGWWRTAEANDNRAGHLIRRDYYRVETISGARFWIFRQLGDRAWFLHGTFE